MSEASKEPFLTPDFRRLTSDYGKSSNNEEKDFSEKRKEKHSDGNRAYRRVV